MNYSTNKQIPTIGHNITKIISLDKSKIPYNYMHKFNTSSHRPIVKQRNIKIL